MTRDAPRRRKHRRAKLLHRPRLTFLKPGYRRKRFEEDLQKLQAASVSRQSSHLHCLQQELISTAWLPQRTSHADMHSEGSTNTDAEVIDAHQSEGEDTLPGHHGTQDLQLMVTGGSNPHGAPSTPVSTFEESNDVTLCTLSMVWKCRCGVVRGTWYIEDLALTSGTSWPFSRDGCSKSVRGDSSF